CYFTVAKILVGLPTGTIARCQDYSFLKNPPFFGGFLLVDGFDLDEGE
ncbi:hypothetical protein NIES298_46790, partial [Microcystis aeruginosa NIES-298]